MDLNPFDLRGPEFLVFYAVFSGFTFGIVWLVQRWYESGCPGEETACEKGIAEDPYPMAALRGGRDEVVRVAVVSLLERELLTADLGILQAAVPDAADRVRRPLDKAILTRAADPTRAEVVGLDDVVRDEADAIVERLKEKGLLPNSRTEAFRLGVACAAVVLLWVVAAAKIAIAISRGRHNVLFLVVLACLAPVLAGWLTARSRTVLGNRVFARLQERFAGLRDRRRSLRSNGQTGELAFLAAAFGASLLPATLAMNFEPRKPTALKSKRDSRRSGGSSSDHWSFGSWFSSSCSCGSSCSGGSSCGGGGCGSGCGGCGGG